MTDKDKSTQVVKTDNTVTFNMPTVTSGTINKNAVAKVNAGLPEIENKTRFFDRNNTQTTLSLMSLTMLNGQSPFRMLRQVLAEIEKRKMALAESQVAHAESLVNIENLQQQLEDSPNDHVIEAKLRLAYVNISIMESKINGAFKDIATLMDAYDSLKEKNNIDDWDEEQFEREEKRHHIRRGFELMYRNLIERGNPSPSTIEYMQQYGIHPQVGTKEISEYIKFVNREIEKNVVLHSNHLEDFLDELSKKYCNFADITTERMFGKKDVYNTDYMNLLPKTEDDSESSD